MHRTVYVGMYSWRRKRNWCGFWAANYANNNHRWHKSAFQWLINLFITSPSHHIRPNCIQRIDPAPDLPSVSQYSLLGKRTSIYPEALVYGIYGIAARNELKVKVNLQRKQIHPIDDWLIAGKPSVMFDDYYPASAMMMRSDRQKETGRANCKWFVGSNFCSPNYLIQNRSKLHSAPHFPHTY